MPKTWTAVTVTADAELTESIGAFLIENGAPGLITEDVANGVRTTAHFEGELPRSALDTFSDHLQACFPGSSPIQYSFDTTVEQDWADNWKAHFQPLEIGKRLWVHPPWITDVPSGRVGVVIDPGMAFGTGQHASTRGCLTFLEQTVRPELSPRVLDIGTGSGVLAIAAAKLGATAVDAVDIDADACRIAVENVDINGVADCIRIGTDIDAVAGTFDVVVANLFHTQLIEMAMLIHDRLVLGGTAIGAGILTTEAASVIRAWTAAGLTMGATIDEGEWTTITAQRA